MPYVTKEKREAFASGVGVKPDGRLDSGMLNYAITKWVVWALGPNPHYEDFNAVIGVLECAKLELYRRMVAPYEDQKIKSNGDVYPCKN